MTDETNATTSDRPACSGHFSGLRWEAERSLDASEPDTWNNALVGGAIGFGWAFVFGGSRLLMAAAGAGLGVLASRYHLNVDWDPDRNRDSGSAPADQQTQPQSH